MSDTVINKFTEFKLFTVVNTLQKHVIYLDIQSLMEELFQTESVAHQKIKLMRSILHILFQHDSSKRNSMV